VIKFTTLALAAMALCAISRAELITIKFTAEVTEIYDWDGSGQFDDITVGQHFKGTYTYDDAVASSMEFEELADFIGSYPNLSPDAGFKFEIGDTVFASDPFNIECLLELDNDYYEQDNYVYHSYNNIINGLSAPDTMISLQLDDYTHTALSSVAIPLTAPDLSKWTQQTGLTVQNSGFFLRAKLVKASVATGHGKKPKKN
jgi:hypothetical protein